MVFVSLSIYVGAYEVEKCVFVYFVFSDLRREREVASLSLCRFYSCKCIMLVLPSALSATAQWTNIFSYSAGVWLPSGLLRVIVKEANANNAVGGRRQFDRVHRVSCVYCVPRVHSQILSRLDGS